MNEAATGWILTPIMQFGFAGMAAILLAVLVFGVGWVLKRCFGRLEERDRDVVAILRDSNEAMKQHAAALTEVSGVVDRAGQVQERLVIKLAERPCLKGE